MAITTQFRIIDGLSPSLAATRGALLTAVAVAANLAAAHTGAKRIWERQRQTGSAFVINLLIETDRVELLAGEPQAVDVPRGTKSKQRIFRCPTCQVAVFSRYTRASTRFVRAGTLDDPSSIAPDVHIYTRSKLPWVMLPESVPAFSTYYDPQKLWPAASLERVKASRRPESSGD